MCLKTIYHNTYSDGDKDVTERVDCCTPGYMCAHPVIQEVKRLIPGTKMEMMAKRGASAYAEGRHLHPPTPRSMSPPSSRGSDADLKRTQSQHQHQPRSSGIYVNGVKVVDVRQRERERERRTERPVVLESRRSVPQVPEAPSPLPIPIKRASTMPYGMETPPERGRRPIIVEERAPRQVHNTAATPGPVEVLEHSSRLHRRPSQRDNGNFLTPSYRRESRSPQGYGSAEDEKERAERRRRRREARERAAVTPSSMPTMGTTTDAYGSYGSSYGSSNGPSFSTSPTIGLGKNGTTLGASPAVAAVKKELRWEDQVRADHNARIERRPKLSRSATLNTNAGLHGEVKSILKNGTATPANNATTTTAANTATNATSPTAAASVPLPPSPRSPRSPRRGSTAAAADDELAELYRSVEGLGLGLHERESSAEWRARQRRESQEEREEREFQDRLRNRFSMPPRRYTAGTGARRRSEIWYPDEGRYKYM